MESVFVLFLTFFFFPNKWWLSEEVKATLFF